MTKYIDREGHSGVLRYKLNENSIIIEFYGGSQYLYTYSSAGVEYIEEMKELAISGYGLNSFINQFVKTSYESKLS